MEGRVARSGRSAFNLPPFHPSRKDIRVTAVQMNALLGKVEHNRAVHRRFIERAARAGADLVCFPERSISGHFCHKDSWKDRETLHGPSVRTLCGWAREFGVFISAGISELIGSVLHNAQALVGPNGLIGRQHKLHMARDEYFFYRGGRRYRCSTSGRRRSAFAFVATSCSPRSGAFSRSRAPS